MNEFITPCKNKYKQILKIRHILHKRSSDGKAFAGGYSTLHCSLTEYDAYEGRPRIQVFETN